jgi:hypothetical protein
MTNDATAGYARIPGILSFPDTTGFAETYGFGCWPGLAASSRHLA